MTCTQEALFWCWASVSYGGPASKQHPASSANTNLLPNVVSMLPQHQTDIDLMSVDHWLTNIYCAVATHICDKTAASRLGHASMHCVRHTDCECLTTVPYPALQRWKAVSAYLKSKQLLPFSFQQQYCFQHTFFNPESTSSGFVEWTWWLHEGVSNWVKLGKLCKYRIWKLMWEIKCELTHKSV